MQTNKRGGGLLNGSINLLPFEVHLPGYQFCGPGTKVEKRLARGDIGINALDKSCRKHDIVYNNIKNGAERIAADKVLAAEAWDRVFAKDSSAGEKAAALTVAGAMKAKIGFSKLGKGIQSCVGKMKKKKQKKTKKKKCCSFKSLVMKTKKMMPTNDGGAQNANTIIKTAIIAARKIKNETDVIEPRIIPIPKSGGLLPLVPLFAGLSAVGSLIGGVSSVMNAIKTTHDGKRAFKNQQITNEGSVSVGRTKTGKGLYLQPYKRGYGLFLHPYPNTKNY